MFSRILHVKNNWRNKLSRDQLSATLMICVEGPDIEKFNPDIAISEWYDAKVHKLRSGPHNYPKKRKTSAKLSNNEDLDSGKESIMCIGHFDIKNNFEKKFFFCYVK